MLTPAFFINAVLFGIGLAMDAFSVSLANGLKFPDMRRRKILLVALIFAIFQGAMPLIGWFFVTRLIGIFNALSPFIPYVALILLCYIGGKMLYDGLKPCEGEDEDCGCALTVPAILIQGIATSIDALSVGLTISDLTFPFALLESFIISAVTFSICAAGVVIGKKFGTKIGSRATVFGGAILIFIGLEIFISSFF